MGGTAPRISVGLAVYNGRRFLADALDSLLSQSFGDFELIISDNASTDDTEEICRAFARRDRRVRYERQTENRGAAWNFNRTFELARGEYFRWAADDDVCAPTYLARCVETLDRNPDVIWCQTRTALIDPRGRILEGREISYAPPPDTRRVVDSRESTEPHRRFRAVLLGSSNRDIFGLMRAGTLRRTSLHLPYYGADRVLIGELSLLGRYLEVPETLFFGRVHPAGSGALRTASEQHFFVAAEPSGRLDLTRLRILGGHWNAVNRYPLSRIERWRCRRVLLEYVGQAGKWWHVITQTATGGGTGRGYVPMLEEMADDNRRPAPTGGIRRTVGPAAETRE